MACMGEKRNAYKIFLQKYEGKRHLEYVYVEGRVTLKVFLNK
jgi:hypothetical protein